MEQQPNTKSSGFVMNSIIPGGQEMRPFLDPSETRRAALDLDRAIEYELKHGRKLDPTMDRNKLRRTVSNRLSAQRSRLKKAHYVNGMERKVAELEETVIFLTIRVERMKERKRLLQLQNAALERLIEIRKHEADYHQMVLEKNRAELERLKEVEKELLKTLVASRSCVEKCGSGTRHDEQVEEEAMDIFFDFDG